MRSPLLVLGFLLAGSLFGAGCKQGVGDRCEVPGDCDTGFCSLGSDRQNGVCCVQGTPACIIESAGSGGSVGSVGGATGQGGASGEGGASGTGGVDGDASDASGDAASDGSGTD